MTPPESDKKMVTEKDLQEAKSILFPYLTPTLELSNKDKLSNQQLKVHGELLVMRISEALATERERAVNEVLGSEELKGLLNYVEEYWCHDPSEIDDTRAERCGKCENCKVVTAFNKKFGGNK